MVIASLMAASYYYITSDNEADLFRSGEDELTVSTKQPTTITVELEGKKSKTKKQKHAKEEKDDDYEYSSSSTTSSSSCDDGHYSKRTLQLAYEKPFVSLFPDHKGQRKFEASSVIVIGDDAYAICDSSWAISKFGKELEPFHPGNLQIGSVNREEGDSGYEALFHDGGTFYVVRESIQHDDEDYHAIIEELVIDKDEYTIKNQCSTEFVFEGDSKGFEGATSVRDLNNEMIVLALCEGNHCSETKKDDRGNGRLIAMRKIVGSSVNHNTNSNCEWKTIRTINVPQSAAFKDYSAIALSDTGRVGITSQEDSQLWVGQLLGRNEAGLWDVDSMEFDAKVGTVYDFPKNDECETIYCNIEGANWINDDMIMAVSDKMKGRGKQNFVCNNKDQSVHVFVLPE